MAGSPHLLLCILEHINILRDTLYFEVIALHLIMQPQDVEGISTCAPFLEVGKKCLWRDVGVKSLRVSEFPHPHILDDGEYELCSLLLRRLVGAAVGLLGFVRRFRACTNDGRGIVIDHSVVGANSCGFDEFRAISCCIRCHHPNEADEVVCASCFVVQDLEEERRHNLLDSREVGVRRLTVYQLELFERIGEFFHNLFRRHGVRSAWLWERFGPLQRQVPSSLALIIHRKK